MGEAVFGLIGVVVGGLLTGLVDYALDRRREVRAVKAAARLLSAPMHRAHIELGRLKEHGVWDRDLLRSVNTDEWDRHRELLASTLDFERWLDLMFAWRGVEQTLDAADRWHGKQILQQHLEDVARHEYKAVEGAMILQGVGIDGPRRRTLRILVFRIRNLVRPVDYDKVVDLALQRIDPTGTRDHGRDNADDRLI